VVAATSTPWPVSRLGQLSHTSQPSRPGRPAFCDTTKLHSLAATVTPWPGRVSHPGHSHALVTLTRRRPGLVGLAWIESRASQWSRADSRTDQRHAPASCHAWASCQAPATRGALSSVTPRRPVSPWQYHEAVCCWLGLGCGP